MPSVNPKSVLNPARGARRAALPLILVLTCAACTDLIAQEKPAPVPPAPPVPPVAPPGPAAEKAADPAPAAQPPRPIDEGAIKALAAEVARLRAELAQLRGAPAAGAPLPGEAPAPAKELVSDVPVVAPDESGGDARQPATSESASEPAPDDLVERVVERVVEREVPVYVDRPVVETHVVVEQPVEVVYYEEIHYGGSSCRQYIPHNHVHSIGCGHHYYGCACHPWYYDLDDCGLSLRFTWVDDDHHHHGRPRYPGRYAAGYRNGFRDGADHQDDRHSAGYASGSRRPSDPVRPLDSGTGRGSRPSQGERAPGAADARPERPPVVSGGEGPSGRRPRPVGTPSGERRGADAATPHRAPGGGGVPSAAALGTAPGGEVGVDLRTPWDPAVRQPGSRDPGARDGGAHRPSPERTPVSSPQPATTFGEPADRRETPDRPRGPGREPGRGPDPTPERPPARAPDRPSTRDRQRDDDAPPPPPPRTERRSEDKGSGGKGGGGNKDGKSRDGGGRRK